MLILVVLPLLSEKRGSRLGFFTLGDGINDTGQVADLSSYPGVVVEVYARRGAIVFRTTSNTPMDGKINGSPAAVGTYYYVINTKVHGQKPVSGCVQLIR